MGFFVVFIPIYLLLVFLLSRWMHIPFGWHGYAFSSVRNPAGCAVHCVSVVGAFVVAVVGTAALGLG